MSILSIDYGDRYIGLAITDGDSALTLRHSVIDQKKEKAVDKIRAILQLEQISKIIVGVPVSLSGNISAQTKKTQRFVRALRAVLPDIYDLEEVDETLTSIEASQNLQLEGSKPDEEHMEAARLILESYLKRQART